MELLNNYSPWQLVNKRQTFHFTPVDKDILIQVWTEHTYLEWKSGSKLKQVLLIQIP